MTEEIECYSALEKQVINWSTYIQVLNSSGEKGTCEIFGGLNLYGPGNRN